MLLVDIKTPQEGKMIIILIALILWNLYFFLVYNKWVQKTGNKSHKEALRHFVTEIKSIIK